MSTENKQKKKGLWTWFCEFLDGFGGSGCSCNCLKTVYEKYAQEEAKKEDNKKQLRPKEH